MVDYLEMAAFYKGKKVFLTGHTGFKGSWLAALLYKLGAEVKGYALPPSYDNLLFEELSNKKTVESFLGDIRDKLTLTNALNSFEPDVIFHLAAQPLVRRSYLLPAETFDVNVTGTANLLEAVRSLEKKCAIVVVTTDKVYENKERNILYNEEDSLGGHDPYSASKACAELVVASFRKSFFSGTESRIALASARAGNVIGGGDWSEDRIIPDIVRSLSSGTSVSIRNPHSVRPWQHVLEPLVGYMHLGMLSYIDPSRYSSAYNFGPSPQDHLTVGELADIAIESWGEGSWVNNSGGEQPHEAGLLKLDIAKAKVSLGWEPKLSAKQAVALTMDWYKTPREDQPLKVYEQINQYLGI